MKILVNKSDGTTRYKIRNLTIDVHRDAQKKPTRVTIAVQEFEDEGRGFQATLSRSEFEELIGEMGRER